MAQGNPIKILVTGFGPFPGVRSNPSGKLIEWIDAGHYAARDNIEISTAILPTSWNGVSEFAGLNSGKSLVDIALHFGVSARARGFQIETIARNTVMTAPDCDGKTFHGTCIEPHAPTTLRTRFAAEPLACKLRQRGLPATVSQDAGRYLCNMLLYLALKRAWQRRSPGICAFIHIPPLRPGRFDEADLLTGLHVIVTHCAGLHRRAIQHENAKSG